MLGLASMGLLGWNRQMRAKPSGKDLHSLKIPVRAKTELYAIGNLCAGLGFHHNQKCVGPKRVKT